MKFNYTQSYKLKLSNIKDKNSYKIKDFEFEITDISMM